jgi:hypothetical protein
MKNLELVMVGGVGKVAIDPVGRGFRSGFTGACVESVGAVGMLIFVVSVDVCSLVVTINGGVGMVIKLVVEMLLEHSSRNPGTHDDDSS